MFSDSRTSAPGEQKGFKPHAPHFIPWLRNSLKPQHSSDLGLSGPYKSNTEARNNISPLEKAKGIGLFSIQGRDRAKKGELRCNGVGMGRMLPVVLRGHHILPGSLGKQREDSSARWSQPAELDPDPNLQISQAEGPQGLVSSSASALDKHSFVRNSLLQAKQDGTGTKARTYGPLTGPFTEEPQCKLPVVVCMEEGRGKVWDYTGHTTHGQRVLHSSSWLSADSQGLIERQQGFGSRFNYIKQQSRLSESQRDLTAREPPVDSFSGSLNGVIVSTEVPQRGLDYTRTLRGPRKPRPSSERIAVLGQNQSWVQHRPKSEGQSQRRREAGCSMKVVHKQIKCVVDNLEQVLTALRDVQQEMKEVVRQIDYLTSSIDLNEEEQWETIGGDGTKAPSDSSSSSGSSSSKVTVGSAPRAPSELQEPPGNADSSSTVRRNQHSVQLCPMSSGFSSERSRTLQSTCRLGSSSRHSGPYLPSSKSPQPQDLTSQDCSLSPQRLPPVRPPTPGLSPLTVNLHPPGSPGSQPRSPVASPSIRVSPASSPSRLSTKPHPPPVLSPSVIIETKAGFYQTPQSDHPSAGPLSPSSAPSASCPPTDSEAQTVSDAVRERASSAGSAHGAPQVLTTTVATAKPPAAQGRRGRKPPPYPHHRLAEHTRKGKEPRKAPPYPEKRRLLSTTV